jgi:hypothetical protein
MGKKRAKPDDEVVPCNSCRRKFPDSELHSFHIRLDKYTNAYYVCDDCVKALVKILGLPEDWDK